jgi:hypothetical protein
MNVENKEISGGLDKPTSVFVTSNFVQEIEKAMFLITR